MDEHAELRRTAFAGLPGTDADVRARAPARAHAMGAEPEACAPHRARGRPRLGVVSKEVTLLPHHWAWLSSQRGGASATLRRLVDEARRAADALGDSSPGADRKELETA